MLIALSGITSFPCLTSECLKPPAPSLDTIFSKKPTLNPLHAPTPSDLILPYVPSQLPHFSKALVRLIIQPLIVSIVYDCLSPLGS